MNDQATKHAVAATDPFEGDLEPGCARHDAVIIKVAEIDRDGQVVHESDFAGEFPNRQVAVAEIRRHLRQFTLTGHERAGDFWWGRMQSRRETRFFVK